MEDRVTLALYNIEVFLRDTDYTVEEFLKGFYPGPDQALRAFDKLCDIVYEDIKRA